eukprot:scaffold6468_cov71-Phaeocystis_antarctica.AAC.1
MAADVRWSADRCLIQFAARAGARLRVAHDHHVLEVLAIRGEATHLRHWCALGAGLRVRLEGPWHLGRHLLPSLEQLFVGLVGSPLELRPRDLSVNILEVGVAASAELVEDIHGPCRAALDRHGDERVALAGEVNELGTRQPRLHLVLQHATGRGRIMEPTYCASKISADTALAHPVGAQWRTSSARR